MTRKRLGKCRSGGFQGEKRSWVVGTSAKIIEVGNRDGGIKSKETRNSRCGIGEPKTRM